MIESISYDAVFACTVSTTVPERTGTDEPHCFTYFSLTGKVFSFLIIGLLPLLQYEIYNRGVVDMGSIFIEIFHNVRRLSFVYHLKSGLLQILPISGI